MQLIDVPARIGDRPKTTGAMIPHDQLDQFSPPEIRQGLIDAATALPGVFTGPSQVSEPGSLALRLREPKGPADAFLMPGLDEFGHIHRTGFMHLMLDPQIINFLNRLGWTEIHPITARDDFFDNIVMLYAPRDAGELQIATLLLRKSWERASGVTEPA